MWVCVCVYVCGGVLRYVSNVCKLRGRTLASSVDEDEKDSFDKAIEGTHSNTSSNFTFKTYYIW